MGRRRRSAACADWFARAAETLIERRRLLVHCFLLPAARGCRVHNACTPAMKADCSSGTDGTPAPWKPLTAESRGGTPGRAYGRVARRAARRAARDRAGGGDRADAVVVCGRISARSWAYAHGSSYAHGSWLSPRRGRQPPWSSPPDRCRSSSAAAASTVSAADSLGGGQPQCLLGVPGPPRRGISDSGGSPRLACLWCITVPRNRLKALRGVTNAESLEPGRRGRKPGRRRRRAAPEDSFPPEPRARGGRRAGGGRASAALRAAPKSAAAPASEPR